VSPVKEKFLLPVLLQSDKFAEITLWKRWKDGRAAAQKERRGSEVTATAASTEPKS
jgi:hypothetical protein